MKTIIKRIALLPLAIALMLSASVVSVIADDDDDRDHEIAQKALSEGRIRSLTEIIDQLKAQLPGQVVGVELEVKKGDALVYEFKVLTPAGKLKEVEVDAATAKVLTIEDDD